MQWPAALRRTKPKEETTIVVSRGRWRGLKMSRLFKAAKQDRLTADWLSAGGDINQELKSQLSILRARSRELEQNSNVARRYLSLCETHIVGPDGFTLQVQGKTSSGDLDTKNNRLIEADFKKWSRRGVCELTGRYSLAQSCRMSARTAARDGDCLIRLHDVQPTKQNPWGFVIELLDPARMDHMLNDDLKNGNRIRLGIELNPSGRPVAYWLKKGERHGLLFNHESHERVDAADIIHWFDADRPEQLRGAPWMASGMLTVHQLDAYQEAAITAARAGASKMGWIIDSGNKHALADEQDEDGDLIEELEPGVVGLLPEGGNFIGFDPKYPHEMYDSFVKTNHRDIAMGWGVSYAALTGDLTDVNFSSTRAGTLEERERWKVKQDSLAATILERIYERWLSAEFFHGRAGQSVSQENFITHRWQGRRWSWVDPLKDIKAIVEAINAGLTSPDRVASELGVDLDEILDQIAAYQQKIKDKKIVFPVIPTAAEVKADDKPKGKKDDGSED